VLEVVVVLQAVAHESVHTDVGEPDESEGQGKGFVLPPSERDDHCCQGSVMGEVVGDGAEARAAEVADHGQVGKKQEYRYEPPGSMGARVGDEGANEQCCRLERGEATGAALRPRSLQ
jgi:hypothetical protein